MAGSRFDSLLKTRRQEEAIDGVGVGRAVVVSMLQTMNPDLVIEAEGTAN